MDEEDAAAPQILPQGPIPTWKRLPTTGDVPSPRSGHVAVVDPQGRNMWVYGGYYAPSTVYPELYHLDLLRGHWTRIHVEQPPELCCSQSAVFLHREREIAFFGGTSFPFGQALSHQVVLLNIDTGAIRAGPSLSFDQFRQFGMFGQSMVKLGSRLYIFGGTNGFQFHNFVFCFNLASMEWEEIQATGKGPSPRYRHTAVADRGCFYVLGGGAPNAIGEHLDDMYMFNTHTHEWSLIKLNPDPNHGYPPARRCHTCHRHDRVLYVIGGILGEVLKDCWCLNIDTRTWSYVEPFGQLDESVYFHSSVLTSHREIVSFGGVLSRSQDRTNLVQTALLPDAFPSLAHLCTRALVQNRRTYQAEELREKRIPANIIRTLQAHQLVE
eukprot:m.296440 g.296440  ORF g.296440 m.296440 type:complete len:382 (-) comp13393_c0_seq1:44-1189(-)